MSQLVVDHFSRSFTPLTKKKALRRKAAALGRAGMRNLTKSLNPLNPGAIGSYWKKNT